MPAQEDRVPIRVQVPGGRRTRLRKEGRNKHGREENGVEFFFFSGALEQFSHFATISFCSFVCFFLSCYYRLLVLSFMFGLFFFFSIHVFEFSILFPYTPTHTPL